MTDADHTVVTKQCTKCGETKPATRDYFFVMRLAPGGLGYKCKTCSAAYSKERNDKKASAEFREAKKERDDLRLRGLCRCVECKEVYGLSNFPDAKNKRYKCRSCMSAQRQAWSEENRDKDRENWRRSRKNNPDAKRERNARYRIANRDRLYAARRQWYLDNKERHNSRNVAYQAERMKSDPFYALVKRTRNLIASRIRKHGYTKKSRTHEILGCDWDFFKVHIERQFLKGMRWDNRSEWHIDHIIPISSAKTEEDVIRLNHFTNLRPLWAKDNLSKGAEVQTLI